MEQQKFFKKIMWMLAVVFVIGIAPCGLEAKASVVDSGTCGAVGNEENVAWTFDSDGVLTVSGQGAINDYVIYGNNEPPWYQYKRKINKIVIGEGITCIGNCAFNDLQETELVLPTSSLKEIGTSAFYENKLLRELHLPDTVTKLGSHSFYGCWSLSEVEIPGSIKEIPTFAFVCTGIKNFIAHEGVSSIRDYFVSSGVERIHLPSTLTQIEDMQYLNELSVICGKFEAAQRYAFSNDIPYLDMLKKYDISSAEMVLSEVIPFDTIDGAWHCTGREIRPEFKVKYILDGIQIYLKEGKEYQISYSNNIEPGTATVTMTGIGCFTGKKFVNFDIYEQISECDINLSNASVQYDGTEKKPAVEVAYQGKELKEGTDYTLSYANNIEEGTARIIIIGKNGYKGTKVVTYQIYKKSIEQCDVNLAYTSVQADGTEKKPAVTVKDEMGNPLQENVDYTLEYQDTVYPGQATVKVSGKNLYKGTKSVPYQIEGISIEDAEFALNETIFTYDGSAKRPSVSVTLDGKALILETDYQVSYKDNVNEGTAYAIIQGNGIYTGAVSMSFTILPYSAGKESVYSQGDTFLSGNFVYEVMDDEELEVEVSSASKKNLTKAVIPATIKCEGITYKVTSIGQKAFYKNTKIKSVEVGNNVTSIENYAFYGCKNMTSLKLGKKVEVIGSSAFRKCTKLTAVTLPKSMEELGKNAFYGCSKLKTITINANSVIDIEEGAIKGISNKAVIKVPKKHYKKYQKKLTGRTGYKKKTMKLKKK